MTVKDATNFLLDFVTKLENDGRQPSYITNCVKVLKSWFRHNEIIVTQRIRVAQQAVDPNGNPISSKVQQEQSPVPEQVRRILNAADHKQKAEIASIAFSGLRPESIGNYKGTDGLKVKDLPEMKVSNDTKTVEFEKIPTLVIVRRTLSKSKRQYFTFMPEEGCQYVKEFLERRMLNGEIIGPDSPIVTSLHWHAESLRKGSTGHITTRKVGQSIKVAIKAAGFDFRPFILRTYFDTRSMLAEADGLMIKDFRAFHMGHVGDIEAVYTVNKGRLPEDVMEKMRISFAKSAEKYIVTTKKHDMNIDTIKAQFNSQFLEIAGYSTEDIEKLGDLAKLSPDDINRMIQEKSRRALGLNGNSQKVVPKQQVKQYIENGWEYVKDLTVDEAIVKLPFS